MFVQNIIATEKKESVKKARKKIASGDFSVFLNDEDDDAIPTVSTVAPAISINSLLSLHEIANQEQAVKSNYEAGQNTLNELDKYQKSILNGQETDLGDLSKSLNGRQRSEDKNLEEILDAIQLRAAVEAAKKESA